MDRSQRGGVNLDPPYALPCFKKPPAIQRFTHDCLPPPATAPKASHSEDTAPEYRSQHTEPDGCTESAEKIKVLEQRLKGKDEQIQQQRRTTQAAVEDPREARAELQHTRGEYERMKAERETEIERLKAQHEVAMAELDKYAEAEMNVIWAEKASLQDAYKRQQQRITELRQNQQARRLRRRRLR